MKFVEPRPYARSGGRRAALRSFANRTSSLPFITVLGSPGCTAISEYGVESSPRPGAASRGTYKQRREMKKTVAALVAVAATARLVTVTPQAKANDGVGAGIAAGLLGGAIVGGAVAASRGPPSMSHWSIWTLRLHRPAIGSTSVIGTATAGWSARCGSATDARAESAEHRAG
jgi:hypothetical protein